MNEAPCSANAEAFFPKAKSGAPHRYSEVKHQLGYPEHDGAALPSAAQITALRICQHCPLRTQCRNILQERVDIGSMEHGIQAGTTPAWRHHLATQSNPALYAEVDAATASDGAKSFKEYLASRARQHDDKFRRDDEDTEKQPKYLTEYTPPTIEAIPDSFIDLAETLARKAERNKQRRAEREAAVHAPVEKQEQQLTIHDALAAM